MNRYGRLRKDTPDGTRHSSPFLASLRQPTPTPVVDGQGKARSQDRQRFLRIPLPGEIDIAEYGAGDAAARTQQAPHSSIDEVRRGGGKRLDHFAAEPGKGRCEAVSGS